jgi:hypothetical protein
LLECNDPIVHREIKNNPSYIKLANLKNKG